MTATTIFLIHLAHRPGDRLKNSFMAKRKRRTGCGEPVAPLARRTSRDLSTLISQLASARADRRRELEARIQHRLTDPGQLADLPAEHPLRRQAGIVRQLFRAVTTAPLPAGTLACLDTIPRQSPLAPWKLLIRALDAFYRRADQLAEANLARIPADSGPGRLVPILRALLGKTEFPAEAGVPDPGAHRAALLERVSAGNHARRSQLRQLGQALSAHNEDQALSALHHLLPWLATLPTDHRYTFIRTVFHHWQRNEGLPAGLIDLISRHNIDPEMLRLAALSLEHSQWDRALLVWDTYLSAAHAAGRLLPSGPETVHILLRMSELFPSDRPQMLNDLGLASEQQLRRVIRAGELPAVFDRAGLLDRARQAVGGVSPQLGACVFRALLAYYERRDGRRAEAEAEVWHAAYPHDLEPLLYLIAAAEKRGALRKALGFVAKAEALNRLHPQLQHSRFRLLLSSAERRIQDAKSGLALADLERLAQEPRANDGDIRAYLLALNWALAHKRADTAAAQALARTLAGAVKNPALHALILAAVSEITQVSRPQCSAKVSPPQAVEGLARVCALFGALERRLAVPDSFVSQVEKNLDRASVAQLHALCYGGLAIGRPALTYIAAGHGLDSPEPHLRHFLLTRGQSLSGSLAQPHQSRARNCLRAARELASQAQDGEVAGQAALALDALAPGGRHDKRPPSQARIDLTLEVERRHPRPPCLQAPRPGQMFTHKPAAPHQALPWAFSPLALESTPLLSPFTVLDIEDSADDETVRAAYLRALRRSPPDRDPRGFAQIREAYEAIQNADKRLASRLFGPPPLARVEDLLALMPDERRHVGPGPWLHILRESGR